MSLEQEIKDFMKTLGVDVVGVAGPGRFDGPPSLDPTYIMKGAKSIISFATPMDVQAIYDFLEKKTALPQNYDQLRGHQNIMHIAEKLVKFLEDKGYKAMADSPNAKWRRTPNPLALTPRFSHRYGAIVSGIAGLGLSGNVVTKEYGAAIYLNSVFTDAVLDSDPMIPPREIFDETCQHCMACSASCPSKMFMHDEEEYSLLNGKLYPRGKKRDVYLCTVSCAGMHSFYPNKRQSTWGEHNMPEWTGKTPDTERVFLKLNIGAATKKNVAPKFMGLDLLSRPYPEGILDPPNLPDYEDLPGETEGQKMKSFVKAYKKATGIDIDDGVMLTCGHCQIVCAGLDIKESQKRYKMLGRSGFVLLDKDKEVIRTHDFEEAVEMYKANPWESREVIKKNHFQTLLKLFFPKWGIDWHGMTRIGAYNRKLEKAIAEQGKTKVHPKDREAAIESMERDIDNPELEFVVAQEEEVPEMAIGD